MKQSTKQVLLITHIIAWIIFIGLCVKTGAILFTFVMSLAFNPEATKNLYMEMNLVSLREYDQVWYIILVSMIIVLSALKAWLFYVAIKIFLTINFVHPFSKEIYKLIRQISFISLFIGIFIVLISRHIDWLTKKGVIFPDMHEYLGGAGEFLLLGAIIFIIAQVFKRGMEIQTENELTV